MIISEIIVRQLELPLKKPYRVSFRTYTSLEPIVIEMRCDDGAVGWGEAYIPAGATAETSEGGWRYCCDTSARIAGQALAAAEAMLDDGVAHAPFASCAMLTAAAMLKRHPALEVHEDRRIPLLVPIGEKDHAAIADEVERRIDEGYRTLKVKVGWEVAPDLARVGSVQKAASGRAEITIDANRGYDRDEGCSFASSLEPEGIALFEQPCEADAWDANAAVARVSTVPLMLDESIRSDADVDRAATIQGVRLVKLKMKRVGGVDRALATMTRARERGLDVCLGDGVATEILCWAEACASRGFVTRAGDMNGFLKPRVRLFANPLPFENGAVVLKKGYWPEIDRDVLDTHTVRSERFSATGS